MFSDFSASGIIMLVMWTMLYLGHRHVQARFGSALETFGEVEAGDSLRRWAG